MAQKDHSFETPRLSVGEWHSSSDGDGRSLAKLVQSLLSPNVTAPLPEAWHGAYSESRARSWIQDRDAEGLTLLVRLRESSECAGLVLLHESAPDDGQGGELRIGYLIAEPLWGRGYASELVRGLVQWAQGQSYGSVMAGVAAEDAASRRVLEKCGFSRIDDDGAEHFFVRRL